MRPLLVAQHLSLDGIIQGPGGPHEDPSEGFTLGGWVAPFGDDGTSEAVQALHASPFELLLGRRTYDIWAAYWPHVPDTVPIAAQFNEVRKHVATHRPESLAWHNSHALPGEVATAVRALKAEAGPALLTWGSGALVRQLLAAGLVDELRLLLYPVVLGRGKRLFDDRAQPAAFRLESATTSPTGVSIMRYVRSGDVRTGAIGVRE